MLVCLIIPTKLLLFNERDCNTEKFHVIAVKKGVSTFRKPKNRRNYFLSFYKPPHLTCQFPHRLVLEPVPK